jgi:hypothetical protein
MIVVSIIYASCDQSSSELHKFRVNPRSNRFLSRELILLVLLTTSCVKVKMLLLIMHCIAMHLGSMGILMCIRMKTLYFCLTSLVW